MVIIMNVFIFFALTANDRGYGHFGGLREHSLSPSDKVNAGAKPAKCTSAANAYRRVLAAGL